MSDTEVLDGDVVPEHAPAEPMPEPLASTAVAILDSSAGAIIRADQPEEILAKAHQIAKPLADLIESAGLAANVGGRRKHVEVGGWQACGTMLGALGGQALHAETIWTRRVAGDDGGFHRTVYTAEVSHFKWVNGRKELANTTTYEVNGFDWEACVEVRTAGGVVVGRAEAMVSRAEEKWSRRDDYALRSMAETRAESRAWRKAIGWIVHLAGYNPTPAEEMGHSPGDEPAAPPFGDALPKEHEQRVGQAIHALIYDPAKDGEPDVAAVAALIAQDAGGYFPRIVARALLHLEKALTALPPEPAGDES
jgi:hypothetical protein